MMFGGEFLIMLVLFFGAGPTAGNDYLDSLPTASYWQAKNITPTLEQLEQDAAPEKPAANIDGLVKALGSEEFKTRDGARKGLEAMGPGILPQLKPLAESKDPEIAATGTALIKEFTEKPSVRKIRQLMAIRTLGERHEKAALPLLTTLAGSRDAFVPEYAQRAIAQMQGGKFALPDRHSEMAGDLNLLPKDTCGVEQMSGLPGPALTLDRIVDLALDPGNQMMMGMGGMRHRKPPDKQKVLAFLAGKYLDVAEGAGDVRIDGVTLGLSEDFLSNTEAAGWGIIAIRGEYDRAALLTYIKAQAGPGDNAPKESQQGNIQLLDIGADVTLVLPSNEQLIIVPSDKPESRSKAVANIIAVLQGAKGTFAQNDALQALVHSIDTTGPIWAAMKLTEAMRKDPPFDALESITLAAKVDKDNGGVTFAFKAQGPNADKLKAVADELTANIKAAQAQMLAMGAQMKALQGIADLLASLTVTADGKTGTMSGAIKPSIMDAMIEGIGPEILMSVGDGPNGIPGMNGDGGPDDPPASEP